MGEAGKRYEEIAHTADVRLRFYGGDERELFANAAFGLFDNTVDLSGVRAEFADEVAADGADYEETLVNFLSELVYRFDGDKRVYRECEIRELESGRVRAECRGEAYDAARHKRKKRIKAATFHDVRITREGGRLSVTVTFDV